MVVQRKYRSRTKSIVLICVIFACLLAAGVFLVFRTVGADHLIKKRFQTDQLDPHAISGAMPGTSKDEKSAGEGMFSYRINPAPVFQTDGSGGDLMVQNPAFNDYFMVVELTVDGIDGMVYQSQLIAPNQYIDQVNLQKNVPSGSYQATAYLNVVDPDSMDLADIFVYPLELTVK